jgi:choline dehydrogenase-like flavoprotein
VARLSGTKHPHTVEISTFMAGKAEAWLKEAGAVQTWKKLSGPGLSAGQHQAGTCRMGNDPASSVVNRYCQVHDVGNVFVIDASVHVTNGGFNPVLTIMAIAYYASDHLVQRWKRQRAGLMPKFRYLWMAMPVLLAFLLLPASSVYYHSTAGEGCVRCHVPWRTLD